MVVPGRPGVQWHYTVYGRALCFANAWGDIHPVPPTTVELHSRDGTYLSLSRGPSLLGSDETEPDGTFYVRPSSALANAGMSAWSLRLINKATRQTYSKDSTQIVTRPRRRAWYYGHATADFNLRDIHLPWDPMLPVLAKIDEVDFNHHAELARVLSIKLKHDQCSVILLEEFEPGTYFGRNKTMDNLFMYLEAASKAPNPELSGRLAAELDQGLGVKTLLPKFPNDTVSLALNKVAATPHSKIHSMIHKSWLPTILGKAVVKATGSVIPALYDFTDIAATCVLLFVTGQVARGRKVKVGFGQLESRKVPTRVRQYYRTDIDIS